MIEILGKTQVDFVAWRRIAFIVSSILCLLGVVSIIQIGRGAANLGIDFAGGTSVQLKFSRPVDLGQVRTLLAENGLKDSEPQQFAGGTASWFARSGQRVVRSEWPSACRIFSPRGCLIILRC